MRFERRPEKTCQKKPLWGKNVQEIWVGTKAQAQSPSYGTLMQCNTIQYNAYLIDRSP